MLQARRARHIQHLISGHTLVTLAEVVVVQALPQMAVLAALAGSTALVVAEAAPATVLVDS